MHFVAAATLLGFAAIAHGQSTWGEEIARSTPEEQGVDSEGIVRMLMEVRNRGLSVDSLLVIRNDRLVAEIYRAPYTRTSRHILYSATKSFNSALLGIAIGQGLVPSVDAKAVDLLGASDWTLDERTRRMTLKHLLTMSTGHTQDTTDTITATSDWVRAFLNITPQQEPGSRFLYNSGASCMISAITQRTSGMTTEQFAVLNLFPFLGITDYVWESGPNNLTIGGWGLYLRPYDMAKFGLMYLHRGLWNGRQIVPETWVDESTRKQVENGTVGMWGSGYGYQFWMNDFGGYRADGANGQYIFVLPQYDAVIVMTSNVSDMSITNQLIKDHLVPALQLSQPLPANPKSNALFAQFRQVYADSNPSAARAPVFTALPSDQAQPEGGTAVFSAANGTVSSTTYQWCKDGIVINGAISPGLTLRNLSQADAGEYTVLAHNAIGDTCSAPASLTVQSAPVITAQPVSTIVATGRDALFQVIAGGGDLTYEWCRNGVALPNATSPVFRISQCTESDAGNYSVVINNPRGSITSQAAALTVAAADSTSHLVSLAARSLAGSGEQTLIVGLIVRQAQGDGGLPLVLRGIGPSLGDAGVTAAMADPAAALFSGSAQIGANGDWKGDTLISGEGTRVGLSIIPSASEDAALFRILKAGAYTMHVTSSRPVGELAVALAEIYDVSSGFTAASPRLAGLAARVPVAPGEGTLIAGFGIDGTQPMRVLIRGLGPTLARSGISDTLADPLLQLYSGNTVIAENDNWGNDPALRAAFAEASLEAPEADSTDAALVMTLQPGSYTAQVRCKGTQRGIALIEVYALGR
ncbi:MAG: serine hydrolase [Opitutaceae bacterium]|jgi:CubicO group peptidase (beta-lactamase class C family)